MALPEVNTDGAFSIAVRQGCAQARSRTGAGLRTPGSNVMVPLHFFRRIGTFRGQDDGYAG